MSHFALAPRLHHGGLIGSSATDVSKDMEGYLVFQRLKDDEWGWRAALNDSTIHILDEAWKVDAEDILHRPWGIIGQNTTVIGCSQQPPTSSQPNASSPSISASDVSPIYGIPSVNHLPEQGDGAPACNNKPLVNPIPSPLSADKSQRKEQTKKDEEGHSERIRVSSNSAG